MSKVQVEQKIYEMPPPDGFMPGGGPFAVLRERELHALSLA